MLKTLVQFAVVACVAVPALANAQNSATMTGQQPVNPPAAPEASPAPATSMPSAATSPAAAAPAAGAAGTNADATTAGLTSGLTVKDNTGVPIGQIVALQPGANGQSLATIKMGAQTFRVAASSLSVQNGAAVINLTQAQLQKMLPKTGS